MQKFCVSGCTLSVRLIGCLLNTAVSHGEILQLAHCILLTL